MDQSAATVRTEEQESLRRTIMGIFSNALHATDLPPMIVLEYAAAAVGSVYREVAESHLERDCICGWEPVELRDISVLQSALAQEALSEFHRQLMLAPAIGHG